MKKIWVCPKCGTASKRYANIKRHGLTVHGESIVPLGYDPLLQRFCLNEQVTYGYQPDFMPYFFPFKDHDKKMTKDSAQTSIESLTDQVNQAADLADALARLNGHNFSTGVHSAAFDYLNPYQVGNSIIEQTPVTYFTGYVCGGCKKAIFMPWIGALTAKTKHEESCQRNMAVSGTADSQEIQSLNDNLIKDMISVAENLFPSKRYVECLEVTGFEGMPAVARAFNIVDLGTLTDDHWALRAFRNQKTEITQEEMRDFIAKASGNFAIFKTNLNNNARYCLMMISS